MYCYSCGSEIPDDSTICPNCGVTIKSVNDEKTGNNSSDYSSIKNLIVIITHIFIILLVITSISGLFNDSTADDEIHDIKLIKTITGGYTSTLSNRTVYCYTVDGVFKNLPDDAVGYSAKGLFYDSDGNLVKEVNSYLDLKYLNDNYFKDSESSRLFFMETNYLANVTNVEVVVSDSDGEMVLNQTVNFKMENFNLL